MVDGDSAVRVDRSARYDWGRWRDYRAMHFACLSDAELAVCKTCKRPTDKTSTRLCDGCWELEHRLASYLRDGGAKASAFVRETSDGESA